MRCAHSCVCACPQADGKLQNNVVFKRKEAWAQFQAAEKSLITAMGIYAHSPDTNGEYLDMSICHVRACLAQEVGS